MPTPCRALQENGGNPLENPLYYVDRIMVNNHGDEYTVIEYTGYNKHKQHTYTIKFTKSGAIKANVTLSNMRRGAVRDRYAATVFGKGCLGEAKKSEHPHEYQIWTCMLERCYVETATGYQWYGGKGVTICDRWLCFENFVNDLPKLPGYDETLFKAGRLRLDKDILGSKGDKVYSPQTCQFVTHSVNMNEAFTRYNAEKSRKIVVFPDGHKELVKNLSAFCREYNLEYRNVYHRLNKTLDVDLRGFDFFFEEGVTTIPRRKSRNRSRAG